MRLPFSFNPNTSRDASPASRLGLPSGWRIVLWTSSLLVVLVLFLPVIYLLIRGLENGPGTLQVLLRPRTFAILGNTLLLAVSVTLASTLIALPLAWLIERSDIPGRRWLGLLTPLPLVIPSYVGAFLYASAFGPRGLLQDLLEGPLGIQRLPDIYGFPGALLALTLMSYPYMLLSLRAAFQQLDPSLEEAARSLGQTAWGGFWRVTLPHLRPALGAGALLIALYTLRDFGAVAVMRFNTFTQVIFIQYRSFDRQQAAALALILVALTLLIVWLEARTRSRGRYYRSDSSSARPAQIVSLGAWKWPALIFSWLVITLALIIPAIVLGFWLVRSFDELGSLSQLVEATGNSMLVSALAAAATLLAAAPLAFLTVRSRQRLARGLERLTYAAYALPGIIIALAMVFFGTRFLPWLYQTLFMLILAYAIMFIPQAVGALRTSLQRINPSLEEAARGLGRSPGGVLRAIILPLSRPAITSGAALVFLTAIKELPATLILAPIGMRTLATQVWNAVSESFFAQAALPALLLILVSSIPLAWLNRRQEQTNR